MSEMIERVAQTIYAHDPITDMSGELTWEQLQQRAPELARIVRHQARDAIEVVQSEINAVLASYLSPEFSIPQCVIARMISDVLNAALSLVPGDEDSGANTLP